MMQNTSLIQSKLQQISRIELSLYFVLILTMGWLIYNSGLLRLWTQNEQYGHGLMVVGLLAYVLYRRRQSLQFDRGINIYVVLLASIGALFIAIVGEASGISIIRMYAVLGFVVAIALAVGGWTLLKKLLIPLLIIFLLIPLPAPLGPLLTAKLQLISSHLGVWVIRLFGGIVYLEGNTIDMGGVKLLVAEACAGLRYLFPLMSIGAIAGYIMHASIWMRWFIFLSTIPITIFLNSFRIGVTGILVENWGNSHTEGFLHFFEGWVVFIFALAILLVLAWLLIRLLPGRPSIWEVFSFEPVPGTVQSKITQNTPVSTKRPSMTLVVCGIALAVLFSIYLSNRATAELNFKPVSSFPLELDEWRGSERRLASIVESVAGASDYYLGDYTKAAGERVNLYISYYESQRYGQIPHSPKVCIPGDGWLIESAIPVLLNNAKGEPFKANRLVITRGERKIIAYYWLKQGGNMYSNEALARIDLIRISLFENRTDGALIRLTTHLAPGETESHADKRLQEFSGEMIKELSGYVPD